MKKGIIIFKNEHDLITVIKRVIEKLKNNAAYSNLPAALAELEKLLPELEFALLMAKSRDKEWVAIKNGKKAIALELLEELAQYVMTISKGDRALIFSAGFEATEEQGVAIETAIETLEVELGT
jgi:hypothetical protein